jgi:hypothetical protein
MVEAMALRLSWLSSVSFALVACGGSDSETTSTTPVGIAGLSDSYSLAMRGTTVTISAETLGLTDNLNFETVVDPEHGQTIPTLDGNVVYQPRHGFLGDDQLQVQVTNEQGDTQTVTILLDVDGGPPTLSHLTTTTEFPKTTARFPSAAPMVYLPTILTRPPLRPLM